MHSDLHIGIFWQISLFFELNETSRYVDFYKYVHIQYFTHKSIEKLWSRYRIGNQPD